MAVSPSACGGAIIRAQAGPARDAWINCLKSLCPPATVFKRLPVNASPQRIFGGLDLTATLRAGHPVLQRGLLSEADGGVVIAAMAERLDPAIAAQIAAALEANQLVAEREGLQIRAITRFAVVALDEALQDEPGVPGALAGQLAFHLDLEMVSPRDAAKIVLPADDIGSARQLFPRTRLADETCEALCAAAMVLGVACLRASIMAGRVARLHAALNGRTLTTPEDAEVASRLVLVPRATQLPALSGEEEDDAGEPQEPPPPPLDAEHDLQHDEADADQPTAAELADMLVAAARAVLPADLLARRQAVLAAAAAAGRAGGRAGMMRKSVNRGRPVGTRTGELRPGARLNIVETLRAAAPWQPLRRQQREASGVGAGAPRVELRKQDFRFNRYQQPSETTAIFIVDASGSSALNRLAEAKGAVELLLADCYVRRDQVALISFRNDGAELLLPPTRSLVRAKASLRCMAGGGGTPLAGALDAGMLLADGERRRGRTPVLVLLTDGQANVSRDGVRDRDPARADARDAARRIRLAGVQALLLDISPRRSPAAASLAAEMGASYVPLPHADANVVSGIVRAHMDATGHQADAV